MESFREEILQILSKISHFIAPMHASSIGALAGFAIALICTWKYLKASGNQPKRLEKHEGRPESSEEYTAAGSSTSVSLHHTHPPAQRGVVIHDPQIPIQEHHQLFTTSEVSKHNTADDCWIIIKNKVYNVTPYVEEHPGGYAILNHAGGDSTEGFYGPQHASRVFDMVDEFYIGDLTI